MIDQGNGKNTLTEHSKNLEKEITLEIPSPTDRIVWSGRNGVTVIPKARVDDPFISAHVKYLNSSFFRESCKDPWRYVQAIGALLEVLDKENISIVPENIFGVILAYLKKTQSTEKNLYNVYTSSRTVARREARGSGRGIKSHTHLFNLINYTDKESRILRQADLNAPRLNQPVSYARADLIAKFDLDWDSDRLLKSLRSFCIFYLCEWIEIRNTIYEQHTDEVNELLSYPNPNERLLANNNSRKQIGESGRHLSLIVFEIVKRLKSPILNEYFSSPYLTAISMGRVNLSDASQIVRDSYCHETLTSTATNIDWISEISGQFASSRKQALATPAWAWSNLKKKNSLKAIDYAVAPNWLGAIQSLPSIKEILGLTIGEEVCLSWLLASDRHQPSNLNIFTLDDISETDNSLTTIIDPYSFKGRSKKSAGTSYGKHHGETYKKNTNVFEAISGYKKNLLRAYENGLVGKAKENYLFPDLRKDRSNELRTNYFRFTKSTFVNYGVKLCAMEGSVSNKHVLENEPNSKMFLELIRHSYLCDKDGNDSSYTITIGAIAQQAVNNSNGFYYSPEATPLSDNNAVEISNEDFEDKIEIDAARHNHSVSTRLNVYADKLPPYIAKTSTFSARVGDEMHKMALSLRQNSRALTTSELRKVLGLSTHLEKEQAKLENEVDELMRQAELQEYSLDEMGFMDSAEGKRIILRHPITIALIKGKIKAIDEEIEQLEYSNDNLINRIIVQRMFLKLVLDEIFTPSELRESDELYGDAVFPFSDILV